MAEEGGATEGGEVRAPLPFNPSGVVTSIFFRLPVIPAPLEATSPPLLALPAAPLLGLSGVAADPVFAVRERAAVLAPVLAAFLTDHALPADAEPPREVAVLLAVEPPLLA